MSQIGLKVRQWCESNSGGTEDWTAFWHRSQGRQTSKSMRGAADVKPLRIMCRNDLLFIAGTIAVMAGLLFPISAHILDMLLIFSISLTAAILIIAFSARSVSQVVSFPLLIVLATMLRMTLSAASAKLILARANAGTIIGLFGRTFAGNNCIITVLIFGIVTLFIFAVVYKSAKVIGRAAANFIDDVSTRETNFFIALAGASRFMFCALVIELAISTVNIVASMFAAAVGRTPGISLKTYITLAVAAAVIMQISALLATIASKYLVRKCCGLTGAANETAEQKGIERIKVVATEVSSSQTQQQQYENTVTDTTGKDKEGSPALWSWQEIKDSESYETITALLESKSADVAKTILMAAAGVEELGVTVPVNVAVCLARRGRRCLLIDLDLERLAISKVFDINSQVQSETSATCVSNLWVRPALDFGKENTTNIKQVITALESRYDHLIIYAPNIRLLGNADKLAGSVGLAMLFGDAEPNNETAAPISDFYKLLTDYGCRIIEPGEIVAEAF